MEYPFAQNKSKLNRANAQVAIDKSIQEDQKFEAVKKLYISYGGLLIDEPLPVEPTEKEVVEGKVDEVLPPADQEALPTTTTDDVAL